MSDQYFGTATNCQSGENSNISRIFDSIHEGIDGVNGVMNHMSSAVNDSRRYDTTRPIQQQSIPPYYDDSCDDCGYGWDFSNNNYPYRYPQSMQNNNTSGYPGIWNPNYGIIMNGGYR